MKLKFPTATYIDTDEALRSLADELSEVELIGVDTESNSLYAYHERVCLVQVSTREKDYIIDPLTIDDMSPLGELLENPEIEKIFHAAEYDQMCLKRDYDFSIVNLFDTMIAARILAIPYVGLANLLDEYLDVKVNKSHQRDNWGKRPLPADSLKYAQMDTRFLPRLRDILKKMLIDEGHLEEAQEIFNEMSTDKRKHEGRNFDPEGFWKLGKPHKLGAQEMAVLREVYLLREEIAQERDIPPFKVLSNASLVNLSRDMPHKFEHLSRVRGIKPVHIRRYGKRIISAVRAGERQRVDNPPRHEPPPPEVSERYVALHTWRKERANERGVESDVILPKHTLWKLAWSPPETIDDMEGIRGLGPWKLKTYGNELLQIIETQLNGEMSDA